MGAAYLAVKVVMKEPAPKRANSNGVLHENRCNKPKTIDLLLFYNIFERELVGVAAKKKFHKEAEGE
ncbi:hypothetical protein [Salinimicrobium sp. HB62]|uniref:hypothetical protein n=1 Tax=Salinimicrobium sp. HB62 TaxID=3077781 RepID=UPI002D78B547|nr:hypothetical protein [Salinimicrobium sp. HB62]